MISCDKTLYHVADKEATAHWITLHEVGCQNLDTGSVWEDGGEGDGVGKRDGGGRGTRGGHAELSLRRPRGRRRRRGRPGRPAALARGPQGCRRAPPAFSL